MPDTLMLTSSVGKKNFHIMIQNRDSPDFDKEKFNPENEGQLLAQIMWHMLPWATVRSAIDKLNEWENEEL